LKREVGDFILVERSAWRLRSGLFKIRVSMSGEEPPPRRQLRRDKGDIGFFR
jgi:hypothetical protein